MTLAKAKAIGYNKFKAQASRMNVSYNHYNMFIVQATSGLDYNI